MPSNSAHVQIDLSRDELFGDFGIATLLDRYLTFKEVSPQEALARAAAAFADDDAHAQRLYDYASRHWFMFATPLLANGGTTRGLPISCFLNYVPDSREGILAHYVENGWLSSMGGGIGTYWGALRSKGGQTAKGSKTSGIIPFIKVVDAQMLAFQQGGTRRGSAAVYLDISHPEIEEFIGIRKPTGGDANRKTLNLHNALCIPDAFMEAVEADLLWDLIDPHSKAVTKTLSARALWRRILEMRVETGEPYLFFSDAANRALPQPMKDVGLRVHASNLCGEITLPTGPDPRNGQMRTAVCCLSSVNLLKFMEWKDDPRFVEDLLRMLDNCLQNYIDTAPASHAAAIYSATQERSVGLGAMGFHSFLQSKMVSIESQQARGWNLMMFEHLSRLANDASLKLGAERGEAPDMAGTGQRFAHKMAIAPNASSGIFCGNVSPCIEPRRANAFLHKTLGGSFAVKNTFLEECLASHMRNNDATWKSILEQQGSVQHLDFLTDHERLVFRTALEVDQVALVRLASDRQPYICQAQSLNLFFPATASASELHEAHMAAWRGGLKSLYYLRSEAIARATMAGLSNQRSASPIAAPRSEEPACLSCEG